MLQFSIICLLQYSPLTRVIIINAVTQRLYPTQIKALVAYQAPAAVFGIKAGCLASQIGYGFFATNFHRWQFGLNMNAHGEVVGGKEISTFFCSHQEPGLTHIQNLVKR